MQVSSWIWGRDHPNASSFVFILKNQLHQKHGTVQSFNKWLSKWPQTWVRLWARNAAVRRQRWAQSSQSDKNDRTLRTCYTGGHKGYGKEEEKCNHRKIWGRGGAELLTGATVPRQRQNLKTQTVISTDKISKWETEDQSLLLGKT